jgi:hypothetical protein
MVERPETGGPVRFRLCASRVAQKKRLSQLVVSLLYNLAWRPGGRHASGL